MNDLQALAISETSLVIGVSGPQRVNCLFFLDKNYRLSKKERSTEDTSTDKCKEPFLQIIQVPSPIYVS